MSFIKVMKVAGAFVSPKGRTQNSKCPYHVWKAVFRISSSLIQIWWYPEWRSRELKTVAPWSQSRRSSMQGKGYLFLTVILLRAQ